MVEKEPVRANYWNFYWEFFLQDCVKRIRDDYEMDWKSKEMRLRQRFVNNVISELLHSKRSDVDLDVYKPFVLCLNLNLLYHSAVNNFLFLLLLFSQRCCSLLYWQGKEKNKLFGYMFLLFHSCVTHSPSLTVTLFVKLSKYRDVVLCTCKYIHRIFCMSCFGVKVIE